MTKYRQKVVKPKFEASKTDNKTINSQLNRRNLKLGMIPGSLVFTGNQKLAESNVSCITYNEDSFSEILVTDIDKELSSVLDTDQVVWINVAGLHDVDTIKKLGALFGLHKLTLEDILSVGQRPKTDEYNEYLFTVLKSFSKGDQDVLIEEEQISIVLKRNILITFIEKENNALVQVYNHLKEKKGSIRRKGADYLQYTLIDAVVDYYFEIVETFGEKLEELEYMLLQNSNENVLSRLHAIRRDILSLRRSIYPLREVISRMEKLDEPIIMNNTKLFLRDIYDHTIQVIDTIEVLRDTASGILDLYMSSVSNGMNGIMKVLAIISTIFMPLTFIAGIYGMNFKYMPELSTKAGYFVVLAIMLLVAIGMLFFFRKKKWIAF